MPRPRCCHIMRGFFTLWSNPWIVRQLCARSRGDFFFLLKDETRRDGTYLCWGTVHDSKLEQYSNTDSSIEGRKGERLVCTG